MERRWTNPCWRHQPPQVRLPTLDPGGVSGGTSRVKDEAKLRERKKSKEKGYLCLTSLPAGWTRVERKERQFHKEVGKEIMERQKREKMNEKEMFIKKFFPESNSYPGGTFSL